MNPKPTNKLSPRRRPSAKKMRTQVPACRKRGPKPSAGGRPKAYSTRITITFPRELNAAIEKLVHAPTGSAKARNRDPGVERR